VKVISNDACGAASPFGCMLSVIRSFRENDVPLNAAAPRNDDAAPPQVTGAKLCEVHFGETRLGVGLSVGSGKGVCPRGQAKGTVPRTRPKGLTPLASHR
jgi:hypothetical protein